MEAQLEALQQQQLDLLSAHADGRDRRAYRSLLLSLSLQRQLLHQVGAVGGVAWGVGAGL